MHDAIRPLLDCLRTRCQEHYGDRLISLVVFGSAARGTAGPESDIDVLVVADGLPDGRVARVREFLAVEREMSSDLATARRAGWSVELSPAFKSPDEVRAGSPLFLDMVEDALYLTDRDGFLHGALDALRSRLAALGARRVWRANAWFWDLKPDYRPGEVFEI